MTTGSTRNFGTNHQVKDIPGFSKKDPSYVPSRGKFLVQRALLALFAFLVMDVLTARPPDVSQNPITFGQDRVLVFRRLGEITAEEFKTRVIITAGQYVGIYIMLTIIHSAISFFTVLSGLYQPREWPPLFGSITEMWSLRQFWGSAISFHALQDFADVPTGDSGIP